VEQSAAVDIVQGTRERLDDLEDLWDAELSGENAGFESAAAAVVHHQHGVRDPLYAALEVPLQPHDVGVVKAPEGMQFPGVALGRLGVVRSGHLKGDGGPSGGVPGAEDLSEAPAADAVRDRVRPHHRLRPHREAGFAGAAWPRGFT